MIARTRTRTEQKIKDKIEELSYIFDISDELRIKYERTKIGYPVQYDDYVRYGMVIALEWVIGQRESLERKNKNKNREAKKGGERKI